MVVKSRNKRWQELEKRHFPLEKLARHYEAYNRSEGKSPRTLEWYGRVLQHFSQYLKEQGHPTALGDLTLEIAREFVLYLQTRNKWENHPSIPPKNCRLAAISVQNYVRGLRAFFSWLQREGYTEDNLLAHLKPPRVPRKLVDVLTEQEVAGILDCLDANTAAGSRDIAMVVTFLDSGLRLSELIGIQIIDAHIDQGYLKVMGKGAKERIVPIGNLAQRALQRYAFHFRPDPCYPDRDYLFLTLEGKPMTDNAVQLVFARLAERSGTKRLHAHLCRHTFATNYLINGGDVFTLQQILGHTSLEMVKRYVNVASAQVRVQHRKFSPMDRMNLGRIRLGRESHNSRSNAHRTRRRRQGLKPSMITGCLKVTESCSGLPGVRPYSKPARRVWRKYGPKHRDRRLLTTITSRCYDQMKLTME